MFGILLWNKQIKPKNSKIEYKKPKNLSIYILYINLTTKYLKSCFILIFYNEILNVSSLNLHIVTFTGKKTYKVTIYYILASQKQSLVSVNWPGEYTFYNSHARIVECVSEYIFLIEKNTHIHIHTHTIWRKAKENIV